MVRSGWHRFAGVRRIPGHAWAAIGLAGATASIPYLGNSWSFPPPSAFGWERDLWHLTSRLLRNVLMHTLAVFTNLTGDHQPLHLADLVA